MIKRFLPYKLKVQINIIKNGITDLFNGNFFNYSRTKNAKLNYIGNIIIVQKIKQTKTTKSKLHNLKIAINKIEKIQINPNEIFSFWKVVGKPSKKNGFAESRSIVNDIIVPTYGGGLCQLSGLIYYACLQANIKIIERYNHSTDIYTDETRFTPLGSDATVVYGFKDLKIKNSLKQEISFSFLLEKDKLVIKINSSDLIDKNNVEFLHVNDKEVHTYINKAIATKSIYK